MKIIFTNQIIEILIQIIMKLILVNEVNSNKINEYVINKKKEKGKQEIMLTKNKHLKITK